MEACASVRVHLSFRVCDSTYMYVSGLGPRPSVIVLHNVLKPTRYSGSENEQVRATMGEYLELSQSKLHF